MKSLIGILALAAALTASAQTTSGPTNQVVAARTGPALQTQKGRATSQPIVLELPKPNEIVKGKITYSGIAVTAVKTRHPLELVNPLASPEYGLPEDNVVRDPSNGRVLGLKFFALKF